MNTRTSPRRGMIAALLAVAAGGAFSFYQLGSGAFACGRTMAGAEIHYWMALAGVQSLLFLGASLAEGLQRWYRLSQYLTIPLVAVPLGQVAMAYPRIFVCMVLVGGAYWYAIAMRRRLRAGGTVQAPAPGTAVAETAIFLLATVVIHSAIAFLVLHSPGMPLDDWRFAKIAIASALLAGVLLRRDAAISALSIAQLPPLGLLTIIVLRAKLPDGGYDSLFYKATLPITIADWRTAITGAMDHSALLGTNFQEIIVSQLRIADPAYPPALTATLAFVGLWIIAPTSAASIFPTRFGAGRALARNVLVLMLVSLTEALVAAGTSYQEPLMGLLLAAALLPMSLAWVFLGAAIAVKVTSLFIVPLILVAKCWPLGSAPRHSAGLSGARAFLPRTAGAISLVLGEALERSRGRRILLAACMVLGASIVGEQFYRNFAYTGRLTGITETLATVTDPEDRVLAKQAVSPFADLAPRGYREKFGNTFVHILTLDRWIKPTEMGFHIIPASRLTAVAAILAVLVLAIPAWRRSPAMVLTIAAWLLSAFVLLSFVWQGRYLYPLSFGAALVIAYLAGCIYQSALEAGSKFIGTGLCLSVAVLATGDQLVGSYINVGWECGRHFATSVTRNNYDQPETRLERKLAGIATSYRAVTARREVIPTILCENTVDRTRYLGAHYIYSFMSLDLNLRHLKARPDHMDSLPRSLLAICFTSPQFPEQLLSAEARGQFTAPEEIKTESGGTVYVIVSKPLMSGAKAVSLVGDQMSPLSWLLSARASDFISLWGPERLTNSSPADAPGGKGALVMESGGRRVGVLIAPFSVEFGQVDFDGRDLTVELAMPYSNSDGMGVDFLFEGRDGSRASARLAVAAKPREASEPAWVTRQFQIPSRIRGPGSLTITATSPSGDTNADWVYFRQLRLGK